MEIAAHGDHRPQPWRFGGRREQLDERRAVDFGDDGKQLRELVDEDEDFGPGRPRGEEARGRNREAGPIPRELHGQPARRDLLRQQRRQPGGERQEGVVAEFAGSEAQPDLRAASVPVGGWRFG
jgi:hypothetical protein